MDNLFWLVLAVLECLLFPLVRASTGRFRARVGSMTREELEEYASNLLDRHLFLLFSLVLLFVGFLASR